MIFRLPAFVFHGIACCVAALVQYIFMATAGCCSKCVIEFYLQTPHVPPSLAQCLQYLQFLHALQFLAPLQVAFEAAVVATLSP